MSRLSNVHSVKLIKCGCVNFLGFHKVRATKKKNSHIYGPTVWQQTCVIICLMQPHLVCFRKPDSYVCALTKQNTAEAVTISTGCRSSTKSGSGVISSINNLYRFYGGKLSMLGGSGGGGWKTVYSGARASQGLSRRASPASRGSTLFTFLVITHVPAVQSQNTSIQPLCDPLIDCVYPRGSKPNTRIYYKIQISYCPRDKEICNLRLCLLKVNIRFRYQWEKSFLSHTEPLHVHTFVVENFVT